MLVIGDAMLYYCCGRYRYIVPRGVKAEFIYWSHHILSVYCIKLNVIMIFCINTDLIFLFVYDSPWRNVLTSIICFINFWTPKCQNASSGVNPPYSLNVLLLYFFKMIYLTYGKLASVARWFIFLSWCYCFIYYLICGKNKGLRKNKVIVTGLPDMTLKTRAPCWKFKWKFVAYHLKLGLWVRNKSRMGQTSFPSLI